MWSLALRPSPAQAEHSSHNGREARNFRWSAIVPKAAFDSASMTEVWKPEAHSGSAACQCMTAPIRSQNQIHASDDC